MLAAIIQEKAKYSLFARYRSALPKKSILSHEISQGPLQFISQDLFKKGGRWYSVTVDYYSDWCEADLLTEDVAAANVISVTKAYFARYVKLDTYLADSGPQSTSQEFFEFCEDLLFQVDYPVAVLY